MAPKGGPARRGEQKMVNTSRKRQNQVRSNRQFPAPPQSPFPHYQSLSPQQKRNIRPFVFFNLPGEIRNLIYTYLLKPSPDLYAGPTPYPGSKQWEINSGMVGCGRVLLQCDSRDNSLSPMRAYGYGYPDLRIMQLCKKTKDEATKFFYSRHHFEIFVGLGHEHFLPGPSGTFRMDCIEDLRILVVINDCCYGISFETSIDLSRLLKATTSLRSLRMAVQVCGRNSDDTVPSAFLIGLIAQIIDATPSEYNIVWENWQGHGHSRCHGWPDEVWHFAPTDVDAAQLQVIAKKWGCK